MEPGDRIRARRVEKGLSVEELAVRVGFAPSTVRAHENGQNGVRQSAAARYARVLNSTPEWIMFGAGHGGDAHSEIFPAPMPEARMVPILGTAQAGTWQELVEDPEPQGFLPFFDERFRRGTVFALKVNGRSMDEFYPDGSTVFVVPAMEVGVREGDHVVVRRERAGLFETSLKEIVLLDGKMALLPRSFDSRFRDIISVSESELFPEIVAVVVGHYMPAVARSGTIIMGGGR